MTPEPSLPGAEIGHFWRVLARPLGVVPVAVCTNLLRLRNTSYLRVPWTRCCVCCWRVSHLVEMTNQRNCKYGSLSTLCCTVLQASASWISAIMVATTFWQFILQMIRNLPKWWKTVPFIMSCVESSCFSRTFHRRMASAVAYLGWIDAKDYRHCFSHQVAVAKLPVDWLTGWGRLGRWGLVITRWNFWPWIGRTNISISVSLPALW